MTIMTSHFSYGHTFSSAVIRYYKLITFMKEHTETNSISIEKGTQLYSQFVEWFNSNCEWINSEAKVNPEQIKFMITANVTGHSNPNNIVYETVTQLYGTNGRGILTDHAVDSMVGPVKEYFESNNSDVVFGDENTFIEIVTDGTPLGTKVYSVVLIDVNEANPK